MDEVNNRMSSEMIPSPLRKLPESPPQVENISTSLKKSHRMNSGILSKSTQSRSPGSNRPGEFGIEQLLELNLIGSPCAGRIEERRMYVNSIDFHHKSGVCNARQLENRQTRRLNALDFEYALDFAAGREDR